MKTTIKTFLLLATMISAMTTTLGYAHTASENKKDGTPIIITQKTSHGEPDRSTSFQATIEGHYFSIYFNQCIGEVHFELAFASGTIIDSEMLNTPNSVLLYLYSANDYEITITLPNGDEYYGEFTITD